MSVREERRPAAPSRDRDAPWGEPLAGSRDPWTAARLKDPHHQVHAGDAES